MRSLGVPYGAYPRVALIYLLSQAVSKQSRDVYLGRIDHPDLDVGECIVEHFSALEQPWVCAARKCYPVYHGG